MSLKMIQAFKTTGLPSTERLVAYMLADHHNDSTGRCDPSVSLLIEETGLSDRAVRYALKNIEKAGHMTIVPIYGMRNSYRLHPGTTCPPAPDAPRHVVPPCLAPDAGVADLPPRHHVPPTPANDDISTLAPRAAEPYKGNQKEPFSQEQRAELFEVETVPTPPAIPKPKRPRAPKPPTSADPRHHAITSAWKAMYRTAAGEEGTFDGRDIGALTRFLKGWAGTSEEFLETARKAIISGRKNAYQKHCRTAGTCAGLCRNYTEIRAELKLESKPNGAPHQPGHRPSNFAAFANAPEREATDGKNGRIF